MHQRGILILAIFSALRGFAPCLVSPAPVVYVRFEAACAPSDAETQLVCGRPLRLLATDQSELEVVPGVTATLATALLAGRNTAAQTMKDGSSATEALMALPHIGAKRGGRLARYLTLN